MTKLECLFKILYLLQSGKILTAKAIGQKLGISTRNARAYINALMNGEVPIMSINGCRGGYYLDEGYFLDVPALTEDEIVALRIVKNMIDVHKEHHFSIEAGTAISKILLAGKTCKKNGKTQAQNRDGEIPQQIVSLSHLAITEKRKMEIVYQSIKEEKRITRKICPYEIIFRDMAWYIYAFCELRQDRRLFHIKRIQEAELLSEHFHMDDDEAFTQDMSKAFGLYRGTTEYTVTIRFAYPASLWVKERVWIENQQITEIENREILYTCTVEGLETMERWVLRYGEMAEVIEPIELKERIRGSLGRMLALY